MDETPVLLLSRAGPPTWIRHEVWSAQRYLMAAVVRPAGTEPESRRLYLDRVGARVAGAGGVHHRHAGRRGAAGASRRGTPSWPG